MSNLETEVKKLGLSGKEAKVYLAILELGQAPAAEIAAHGGVNRATTYVILEELRHKGLISSFEKGKKTVFAAEPPERLFSLFEMEKRRLEENFLGLKKILPDLEKLYEIRGERPKVRFFEGKNGIVSIREDVLKTKTKYFYQIVPLDESYRFFPPQPSDHREAMAKKLSKILRKTIYTTKKGAIFPEKSGRLDFNKYLPNKKFTTEIVIYGRKVALIAHKNKPIGVIIEDEAVSSTAKVIFELVWDLLK